MIYLTSYKGVIFMDQAILTQMIGAFSNKKAKFCWDISIHE